MEIFDVQRRDIHGGSFRLFVRRSRRFRPAGVAALSRSCWRKKNARRPTITRTLEQFAQDVANNREELRRLLLEPQAKRQAAIVAVSAPAKGMTLLNYCRLGADILDFVTEKSKLKIGRYTPGRAYSGGSGRYVADATARLCASAGVEFRRRDHEQSEGILRSGRKVHHSDSEPENRRLRTIGRSPDVGFLHGRLGKIQ